MQEKIEALLRTKKGKRIKQAYIYKIQRKLLREKHKVNLKTKCVRWSSIIILNN